MAEFFETEDAEITIVAYGCVARSAKRAVIEAREKGMKVGLLKLMTLWPFMRSAVEKVLQTSKILARSRDEYGADLPGGETGEPGSRKGLYPQQSRWDDHHSGRDIESNHGGILMPEVTKLIHKYLRHDKKFPHVWCPGCGIGIMLGALIRAIDRIGYEKDEIVLVSGIGCSGRLPVYVDFNTLHTTHGRALTFATGVKLAKPNLKVIVIMGDGDAVAIGGNHFIHAARRNIDVTAIIREQQHLRDDGWTILANHALRDEIHDHDLFQYRTGLQDLRTGGHGRSRLCREGNGLSCQALGQPDGEGAFETGIFRGGGDCPLPYPVWKAEPSGVGRGDDGVAAGSCRHRGEGRHDEARGVGG